MSFSEIFLPSIACLIIGFLIGRFLFQNRNQPTTNSDFLEQKLQMATAQNEEQKNELREERLNFEKKLETLKVENEILRENKVELSIMLSRKESDFDHLWERHKEQKNEVTELQQKFSKEFENLANKILEEKSLKFTEQNKVNIASILSPLQEKIMHFEKKVDDTHKQSIDYHAALREQIRGLSDINAQMSKETINLTKALKGDSKIQGNWGELILERVLIKSGLEKGREYEVQQSFTTETGSRLLPDIVINLPDGKKMIVDSKVSLTAYERFSNEEDEQQQANFLKMHVQSIRRHIDQLASKNYQDLYKMESPDFVLLFIPIEIAFALALKEDSNLYSSAFEKNIIIVTPTTLLATLRTIDSMWTNQKQQENAMEIARQAGALYDKFEGFVTNLTNLGKRLDDSKSEYDSAMNKLHEGKGNLVNSVEKLRKMGAKAKKELPEAMVAKALESDNTDNLL